MARPTKRSGPCAPNLGPMNDEDIDDLMARLPLTVQLTILARTWEAIEKMTEPQEIDPKMKASIERLQAALRARRP